MEHNVLSEICDSAKVKNKQTNKLCRKYDINTKELKKNPASNQITDSIIITVKFVM